MGAPRMVTAAGQNDKKTVGRGRAAVSAHTARAPDPRREGRLATMAQNPTTQHPQPEQPEQKLEHPGLEAEMEQRPDYGEDSYRGHDRLKGRRALITGGDSGIGRAVALAFAREGADVVISHLPEEEQDGRETVRVIQAAGRKGIAVPGDLTNATFCRELVEGAAAELGGLDILVNNAAFQMSHESLQELPDEEIEHTVQTNIFAL